MGRIERSLHSKCCLGAETAVDRTDQSASGATANIPSPRLRAERELLQRSRLFPCYDLTRKMERSGIVTTASLLSLYDRKRGPDRCLITLDHREPGDSTLASVPPNRLVGKLRPPLIPDAAPHVNRFRQSLSRCNDHAAVLTSSHCFRHFIRGSLAVLFMPDT